MNVTDQMVEACAAEMVKHGWLNQWWDYDGPVCGCCERPLDDGDSTPEPEDVRREIRTFLTAAFGDKEACNQCGGTFEPVDGEIVGMLRCKDCGREIPQGAIR